MKKSFLRNALTWSALVMFLFVALVSCKDDPEPDPITTYEDGIYLVGPSTAFTEISVGALMDAGINEDGQKPRSGMFEQYIAVSAAGDGFQLVKVEGGTPTYYGPKTTSNHVMTGADWQIKGTVKIGTVGTESGFFKVAADGLYNFVYDKTTNYYAIIPVPVWQLNNPEKNLPLKGSFSKEALEYEATNVIMRGSTTFKFRFSDGWKVKMTDSIVGTGNAFNINTNFGGVFSGTLPNMSTTFVAGGTDYAVGTNSGVYTVNLKWTSATGFKSTFTRTGDVPGTIWTGVVLDMIGAGVSSTNVNAVVSTTWSNWGYTLLADNTGIPTITGSVYTWTWNNVVLDANAGFKIRTKDGVAPATNGANFDVGFSAISAAASSLNIKNVDNNMGVSVAGIYDVSITIDAANADAKVVTIKDNVK